MKTIEVKASGAYQVKIGRGLLDRLGQELAALAAGSVNSSPPAKISAKNPRQSARPGDNVLRLSGLRRSEKTVSSLKAVVPFVLFPKKSRIKAFFIISRKSKFV